MQISERRMQNCEFGGQRARVSERNIEPVRAPAGSPGCSRVSGGTLGWLSKQNEPRTK